MLLLRENRSRRVVAFFLGFLLNIYPFFPDCRADERAQINPRSKITFNQDQLNEKGLYGPPDGLRALHYEFCIPGDPVHEAQVRKIDPTIQISRTSPGRIGCTKGEYLCIGSTHQANFRIVLLKLANLAYVKQIDQCFFE